MKYFAHCLGYIEHLHKPGNKLVLAHSVEMPSMPTRDSELSFLYSRNFIINVIFLIKTQTYIIEVFIIRGNNQLYQYMAMYLHCSLKITHCERLCRSAGVHRHPLLILERSLTTVDTYDMSSYALIF